MASTVKSFALVGVDGYLVDIETNTVFGQPLITIIGLGDQSIKEANERIQAAIIHEGYIVPKMKIVINLAPGDIKKKGSHFDLGMAIGLLQQSGQITAQCVKEYAYLGELSLNGRLRGCNGVLPMIIAARRIGIQNVIVPNENLEEACLVKDIAIFGFDDLKTVVSFLEGKGGYEPKPPSQQDVKPLGIRPDLDFSDVKGQDHIISYAVVAAAGGHNMLMIGEPGCGKSMIAQRLPTILPVMSEESILPTLCL